MPGGKEAEDIVSETVEGVLSGKRAWDSSAQLDLFAHLKSIIDSKLNHLAKSRENRLICSASAPEDDTSEDGLLSYPDHSTPLPLDLLAL